MGNESKKSNRDDESMKLKAIFMEDLIEKYSYDNALILEIGADKKRNFRTKYPEIISFVFKTLNIKKMITLEIDTKKNSDIIADARKLPFKDSTFDIVILISVLEHCYINFEDIVKESNRVISQGGIAIGFVPFFLGYHGNDYWRFTYEGIEKLLKDFKKVMIIPVGGPFSVSMQIVIDMIRPKLLSNIIAYILSPFIVYVDRFLWKVYKTKGKIANFICRGYLFINSR